jgi:hypothetical protein
MMRKSTPQPDLRPAKGPPETRRGGAYGKDLHDVGGNSWLHGGDPSTKPGYVRGLQGKQQKRRPRWPY